jgi:pimeloyl-ACP methyl ester carboxylesterase
VVEGGGHAVIFHPAEAFNRAMLDFVEALPAQ